MKEENSWSYSERYYVYHYVGTREFFQALPARPSGKVRCWEVKYFQPAITGKKSGKSL